MRGVLGVLVVGAGVGMAHADEAAPVSPDPAPEPARAAWTSHMDAVHARFDAFAALGVGWAFSSSEANRWHPLARLGLGWTRQTALTTHAIFASYEVDRISRVQAGLTFLTMRRRSLGAFAGPTYNFTERRFGVHAGACLSIGASDNFFSSAFRPCLGVSLLDRDGGTTFAVTYTTIYELRALAQSFGGG